VTGYDGLLYAPRMRLLLVPGLLACVVACGPSEAKAREHLESQGITATEIKKNGDAFEFVGTKGDQECKGTLSISGGNSTMSSVCGPKTTAKSADSKCKPGAKDECMKEADALYNAKPSEYPAEAADLYRIACNDKSAKACGRVTEFELLEKQPDKAREWASKGCDLDDSGSCYQLAKLVRDGRGGATKDSGKATALFQKSCKKDPEAVAACRAAAGMLLDSESPDFDAAIAIAEKLCTAKFEDGCFVLGYGLFQAKRDYPRSLTLLEQGCTDDTLPKRGLACNLAGAITLEGLGMKKDPARGMANLEKACAADFPEGCFNVGKFYKFGAGVKKDPAKAKVALEKACKLGVKEAC
jgi:uncharacterized protein